MVAAGAATAKRWCVGGVGGVGEGERDRESEREREKSSKKKGFQGERRYIYSWIHDNRRLKETLGGSKRR
jgi:hypothetical protein